LGFALLFLAPNPPQPREAIKEPSTRGLSDGKIIKIHNCARSEADLGDVDVALSQIAAFSSPPRVLASK
jgi:hypothetical protein